MTKYRAQIIWDFEFDDKGITESEYEWRFDDEEELEGFSRTPAQMEQYAKDELIEALWSAAKYNDFYQMVDVVKIEE
jgi:hypothetical protein